MLGLDNGNMMGRGKIPFLGTFWARGIKLAAEVLLLCFLPGLELLSKPTLYPSKEVMNQQLQLSSQSWILGRKQQGSLRKSHSYTKTLFCCVNWPLAAASCTRASPDVQGTSEPAAVESPHYNGC